MKNFEQSHKFQFVPFSSFKTSNIVTTSELSLVEVDSMIDIKLEYYKQFAWIYSMYFSEIREKM